MLALGFQGMLRWSKGLIQNLLVLEFDYFLVIVKFKFYLFSVLKIKLNETDQPLEPRTNLNYGLVILTLQIEMTIETHIHNYDFDLNYLESNATVKYFLKKLHRWFMPYLWSRMLGEICEIIQTEKVKTCVTFQVWKKKSWGI
jgi:hypothetical protein